MSQATLTPANCDLRDFAFMPLDVARLRDSELASNEAPEACWAAVLLWGASWHQVPAASIPNDDKWMAQAAGYGRVVKEWLKVRSGALRGWVECVDGRLYHPVVAEKALEAWDAKLRQRWATECSRIKKHNERHGTEVPKPAFDEWKAAGCHQGQPLPVPRDKSPCPGDKPGDNGSKGQGQGQGQGQGHTDSAPTGAGGAAPPAPPDGQGKKPKTPAEIADAKLWRDLKALFVERQAAEGVKAAGELLGYLAKKYGADTFKEAARATLAVQPPPIEPHTYLVGLCETAAGKRVPLNRQEAIEQRNRAVGDQWLREQEALDATR